MPSFDFPIRTNLAIWAVLGVLLVAGMLAEQQVGDHWAVHQRAIATNKQAAAVEALRAAKGLGTMQIEMREMRLAIVGADIDRALQRLRTNATAPAQHIATATDLTEETADKQQLQKINALANDYVAVSAELAAAAKDYGDTDSKIQSALNLGRQMNALIEEATEDLMGAAEDRNAQASAEGRQVSRINLGIGLFAIAVLTGLAVFGAVAIATPSRRVGEVLRALAQGNKGRRALIAGGPTKSATMPARRGRSRKSSFASSNWKSLRRK
ncbi:MAG: hypothetical protein WBL55_06805 [Xanthobacteraceae bacterium]